MARRALCGFVMRFGGLVYSRPHTLWISHVSVLPLSVRVCVCVCVPTPQSHGVADRRYLDACEERDALRLGEHRLQDRLRVVEADCDAKTALTQKLLQEVDDLRQDKLALMEEV